MRIAENRFLSLTQFFYNSPSSDTKEADSPRHALSVLPENRYNINPSLGIEKLVLSLQTSGRLRLAIWEGGGVGPSFRSRFAGLV